MLVHCLITPNPPTHDVFTQRMGVYSAQMRDVVTAATFLCQKTLLSQTFSPIRRETRACHEVLPDVYEDILTFYSVK